MMLNLVGGVDLIIWAGYFIWYNIPFTSHNLITKHMCESAYPKFVHIVELLCQSWTAAITATNSNAVTVTDNNL